jgi:hypothetical protein
MFAYLINAATAKPITEMGELRQNEVVQIETIADVAQKLTLKQLVNLYINLGGNLKQNCIDLIVEVWEMLKFEFGELEKC